MRACSFYNKRVFGSIDELTGWKNEISKLKSRDEVYSLYVDRMADHKHPDVDMPNSVKESLSFMLCGRTSVCGGGNHVTRDRDSL